jgi:hydroxyacylglutathione hydrolase
VPPVSPRSAPRRRLTRCWAAPDEDDFACRLLASLGSYPVYFARLGEVNRRGPGLLTGDAKLAPLTPAALRSLVDRGAG